MSQTPLLAEKKPHSTTKIAYFMYISIDAFTIVAVLFIATYKNSLVQGVEETSSQTNSSISAKPPLPNTPAAKENKDIKQVVGISW